EHDVVGGPDTLVDQSLVQVVSAAGGQARFRMLETIREFAAERLAGAADADPVRDAHARYYLTLAEQADEERRSAAMGDWVGRLARERANLHSALRWFLEQRDAERALRLVAALAWDLSWAAL